MYAADNPVIQRLLEAAGRDEATLRFPVPSEVYGFHVQQAVEKLFKVLISAHGHEFKLTHDLEELVLKLATLSEVPTSMELTFEALTDYAVETRYFSGAELDDAVRDALRQQVADLRLHVKNRLLVLRAAGIRIENQ